MSNILELGRCKTYEGPEEERPVEWVDEPAPPYTNRGTSIIPPELRHALPITLGERVGHEWIAETLGLGDGETRILFTNKASLIDVLRVGRWIQVILRWTAAKSSVNPLRGNVTGKIANHVYGFVSLPENEEASLLEHIRAVTTPLP